MGRVHARPISEVIEPGFPAQILDSASGRKNIAPIAMRLFFRLTDKWGMSIDDKCILLGGIGKSTAYKWQDGNIGNLSRDQIERISLLLGIEKGLKLLFADEATGLKWLKNKNHDISFGGNSPIARMLVGSITDLYAVRRYLDAWRGSK